MSDFPDVSSSIAVFENVPQVPGWPEKRVIDLLVRESIERLFEICRSDPRAWLSDADLESMLFSVLRQYLPQHGLAASAVHSQVQIALPPSDEDDTERHPRSFRADIGILVPRSLDPATPEGKTEISAVIQISRTFKVDPDLEVLGRLIKSENAPLVYLAIVAHKELESDATRVRQLGKRHNLPVMILNYWGKGEKPSNQPGLFE